jgi:hypothetical protein
LSGVENATDRTDRVMVWIGRHDCGRQDGEEFDSQPGERGAEGSQPLKREPAPWLDPFLIFILAAVLSIMPSSALRATELLESQEQAPGVAGWILNQISGRLRSGENRLALFSRAKNG